MPGPVSSTLNRGQPSGLIDQVSLMVPPAGVYRMALLTRFENALARSSSAPINLALLAAVQPAQTSALYFVAKGDGSSHFSATLDEHNRAVNRYQRGQKKADE